MNGEDHAWELLSALDPLDVCERSLSSFNPVDHTFTVKLFGTPVTVAPGQRTITWISPDSELILTKIAYFSRLSILHHLIRAQACAPSGRLVRPSDLKVGAIYFNGSHVLPLESVASRYGRDAGGFMRQGLRFGGQQVSHGDAAVSLLPLPRIPVILVFWREDDEFAARADLLFDATCERHVPPDILWSIAMMSVLVMTK